MEFRTLGAEVMSQLPTKESAESDDSIPILVAGERLAPVGEAVQNDSALVEEALLLYEGCAASAQYPDSVRALCFYKYKKLGRNTGKSVSQRNVPAPIRSLAEKLRLCGDKC
jgi:hypothetical protein